MQALLLMTTDVGETNAWSVHSEALWCLHRASAQVMELKAANRAAALAAAQRAESGAQQQQPHLAFLTAQAASAGPQPCCSSCAPYRIAIEFLLLR